MDPLSRTSLESATKLDRLKGPARESRCLLKLYPEAGEAGGCFQSLGQASASARAATGPAALGDRGPTCDTGVETHGLASYGRYRAVWDSAKESGWAGSHGLWASWSR